jgi:hypothetical protein
MTNCKLIGFRRAICVESKAQVSMEQAYAAEVPVVRGLHVPILSIIYVL